MRVSSHPATSEPWQSVHRLLGSNTLSLPSGCIMCQTTTQRTCVPENITCSGLSRLGRGERSHWHDGLCHQECRALLQLASLDHSSSAEDQRTAWLFDLLGSIESVAGKPVPVRFLTSPPEVTGKNNRSRQPAHTAQTSSQNCVCFLRCLRASPTGARWHSV